LAAREGPERAARAAAARASERTFIEETPDGWVVKAPAAVLPQSGAAPIARNEVVAAYSGRRLFFLAPIYRWKADAGYPAIAQLA